MMGSMMLPTSMQGASSASPLLRRRRQPSPILRPSIPLLEYHPDHSLLQLIRERDWYGVRLRLQQQKKATNADICDGAKSPPDVASCSSKDETTTPLHAACLYRAPPDVILRLIQADPTALTTTDAEGWIPLHVHLLYHNSPPNNTCAAPTLAIIAAGGAVAANRHLRFGGAALHLACRHGASLAVLQALVDLAPQQIATPTPSGSFAAHMLLRSASSKASAAADGGRSKQNDNNKEELMEKLLVLIRAWVQHKTSEKTHSIRVADVVRFQVICAPGADVVGEFLSSSYYHREQKKQRGLKRNADATALHVAAAAPLTFCDPLPPVLQAFPESASIRPYPLHIALRHSHSALRNCTALLNAYPAALEERDARSHLYPFQLAAAHGADDLAKTNHQQHAQLDTIYSLLRRAPHVLSNRD